MMTKGVIMSEIVIPGDNTPPEENEDLKYQATEEDEERFFLMYHMSFQPSETEALSADYRKWLIARFMGQKAMEKEMMERHRLMSQLGPQIMKG
jgi:hypothetical protein